MLRFILGTLALFCTAIFAFVIEGGNPASFVLPTPLLIVVCVPGFAVLAVWSLKDWGRAWKEAFASEGKPGAGTAAASAQPAAPSGGASAAVSSAAVSSAAVSSARLWDFYEKSCYIAGVVGFILGLNIIFQNGGGVELKDMMSILKPLSIDCIAPILAILLAMVARILRARVERNRV
jgi:hypothetical protein